MLAGAAKPATIGRAAAWSIVKRVRARFDSAVTTDENRRHWQNADALSAGAAALPQVRRQLRMRSRYEVANNSYAKGLVVSIANYTVGTGVRLQMQTGDEGANDRIEEVWEAWAHAVDLAGKLRTMRMAKTQDGEVFGIKTSNPKLPTAVKLDLRLVEGDQIANPWTGALPSMSDGIDFDPYGNPAGYHLLKNHPGDLYVLAAYAADLIPARNVIHYFRVDRPGQLRGIPELTPALPLFAQLRRYTQATLSASEQAATMAALLETPATPDGTSQYAGEPFETTEMERGMLTVLPEGVIAKQMKAEQPVTQYPDFTRMILIEIGRCAEVPRHIMLGDSSQYNYASGRLDTQAFVRTIQIEQTIMERVILDVLLADFLEEAVRIEGLLPQFMRRIGAQAPHQWFWDGQEHVDPQKEAIAQGERLLNHTTTYAREYGRQGLDWRKELTQAGVESEFLKARGLEVVSKRAPVDPNAAEPVPAQGGNG